MMIKHINQTVSVLPCPGAFTVDARSEVFLPFSLSIKYSSPAARVHPGAVQPTVQLWRPLPAIYHPLQPTCPWRPHTTSEAPVSITRAQYTCIVWFIWHQCRCSILLCLKEIPIYYLYWKKRLLTFQVLCKSERVPNTCRRNLEWSVSNKLCWIITSVEDTNKKNIG